LSGILHRAVRQAIYDEETHELIPPGMLGSDDMLITDWLMLSFIPNILDRSHGASIVDASCLHGQGIKAFGQLSNDVNRLNQLVKQLDKKGISPGQHFQALYRINIKHDNDEKSTFVHSYDLVDVARVKSKP
jgi:hypothetical protein